MTVVLDELQQLQPKTLSDPELGTGKHLAVFLKDGMPGPNGVDWGAPTVPDSPF